MEKVIKISTHGRANYVAFLLADGTVAVCGNNGYGQLGMLDPWQPKVPTIIPDLTDVKSVACSCASTIFILNDGTMKVSGREIYNYLGISKEETTLWVPTLSSITNVKEACCGYSLMLYTYLLNDGSVIVSGNDAYGALGLNRVNYRVEPTLNPYLSNISKISLSDGFCNYLLEDKIAKYCGNKFINNTLQLTTVPSNGKIKQVGSGQLFAAYLMEDGTVKVWGNMGYDESGNPLSQIASFNEVTAIEGLENVIQIACGGNYVLCLQGDGTVKAFGFNTFGTFGLGNKSKTYMPPTLIPGLKDVVQVACTEYCSYFLLADSSVMGCGRNESGQLGVGDNKERLVPTLNETLSPTQTTFYLCLSGKTAYAQGDGALKEVAADFTALAAADKKAAFLENGTQLPAAEKLITLGTPQILIYSTDLAMKKPTCTVTGMPKAYLHKTQMLDLTAYGAVEQVAVDATCSGGGSVKLLASTDGEVYKTLKNSVWETVDATDAAAVASNGMESSALSDITEQQWADLLGGQRQLGFLALLDVTASSGTCEVKSITVHAKDADGDVWSLAVPGVDYTYKYTAKTNMQMTFLKAGEYMVNYQR